MPYIFVRDYDIDLMEMNKDIRHVFVESVLQTGGERKVAYLRQNERLPMTLRENYSPDMGFLSADTEVRDIKQVEGGELQNISRLSYNGANVCVPISPLSRELDSIQKDYPQNWQDI